MTHGLRTELFELDLDSVHAAAPPAHAKSGAGRVGVLVASGVISASTIKAIATVARGMVDDWFDGRRGDDPGKHTTD